MSNLTTMLIWIGIIAVIFGILWWQGQLQRINAYVAETREELKKCTWPTWDELKGSTVLVAITMFILGVFTVFVDQILYLIFFYVV